MRRRHPWLARARTTVTELSNETAVLTSTDGADRVVALLNIGDQPHTFPIDDSGLAVAESSHDGRLTVPGHGWTVLSSAT
jgi:cyclomaltodextrinase / maltogenic alpha-amylase / neopullulanase